MDAVLLHNENAGDESWSRSALMKLVRRAGVKPKYLPLRRGLARPKLLEEGDFVIVAGGDGAIRKAALALIGRDRPIAPLPLGTANNIVRSFGLSLEPEKIVAGWRDLVKRPFDVGVIAGPWGKRYFIEGVGVGLISRSIAILEEIDADSVYEFETPEHKLHRDICVAAALARAMSPIRAQIAFAGHERRAEFLLIEILNIRRAGPGVELAPRANPSDGSLDLVTATVTQRPRLMHTLKARLKDARKESRMTTRRLRQMQLDVHVPCEIRIDDNTMALKAGATVEITVQPGRLEFLLPAR